MGPLESRARRGNLVNFWCRISFMMLLPNNIPWQLKFLYQILFSFICDYGKQSLLVVVIQVVAVVFGSCWFFP